VPYSLTDLAGPASQRRGFLAAVLETTALPIWVVDPDGRIRFANPAAIAALGYDDADELLGRHSHETIHYKHPEGTPCPAAECPMLLAQATGETVARDLDWFFRRDGSMFPVSYVSAPIEMPEGRGAVVTFSDAEDRVCGERLRREQEAILAAQRRVATLVAGGAASAEVFAAVAREVGEVIGLPLVAVWRYEPDGAAATVIGAWGEHPHPFQAGTRWPLDGPTICAQVLETGSPARIDDFAMLPGTIADAARKTGIYACAGAPIIVDGDVWGAMSADSTDRVPLPDRIEDRLAEFTELVATAISNTASRAELARLADQEAALRRVATLVARGVPPPEVFAAVAREVGLLLGVDATHMARYEPDGTAIGVAAWSPAGDQIPIGTRVDLEGESVAGLVFRTGRPARIHGYENASGTAAALGRELGLRSSVGAPIVVDRRRWGVTIASSKADRPLPADAESRIAAFTELVATAISNTEARTEMGRLADEQAEARTEMGRLADEQAALRRVATLVARGVPPEEVFAAVAEEVGRLLGTGLAGMARYESDDMVTVLATWAAEGAHDDAHPLVPGPWPLEGGDLASTIARTGRPVRIDDYRGVPGRIAAFVRDELGIASSVGSPIVVEGRLWGALFVHSKQTHEPLPRDTESRLAGFTELVATAISNTEARTQMGRLADEQAALRRVATLVARGMPAAEVFSAVAEELERLLDAQATTIGRLERDRTLTIVASSGSSTDQMPMGTRLTLESGSVLAEAVLAGRAVRVDDYSHVTGLIRQVTQRTGIRCSVAVPIMVEGSLWGSMGAGTQRQQFPADAEQRVAEFTELVATAVSNIQAREDLAASRARIVAAADDERRRVVRDLHDGAQQRLVHTVITLKLAHRALQNEEGDLPALLTEALDHAQQATAELRELAHGILPAVLTQGGLRAGVEALASRMPVPVENGVSVGRLPAAVEATAYFVVAEALTNVAKHARARRASVAARVEDGSLQVQVRDDGVGGARPDGSGLLGLADRLAVLDGQLWVESPADGGTLVAADLPVPD
jgi:PAS domain S-box-containing protein